MFYLPRFGWVVFGCSLKCIIVNKNAVWFELGGFIVKGRNNLQQTVVICRLSVRITMFAVKASMFVHIVTIITIIRTQLD